MKVVLLFAFDIGEIEFHKDHSGLVFLMQFSKIFFLKLLIGIGLMFVLEIIQGDH